MIDTEGNVFGYVTGQLTADMMESIVTQTMTGQRVSLTTTTKRPRRFCGCS